MAQASVLTNAGTTALYRDVPDERLRNAVETRLMSAKRRGEANKEQSELLEFASTLTSDVRGS